MLKKAIEPMLLNKKYFFILALFLVLNQNLQAQSVKSKPDMTWFKDAKFGLFLHWGLYSQTAGDWNGKPAKGAEHFMLYERIPVKTYAAIADQFNPSQFNADNWVRQAKIAGMKYIVFTTKHHDGFALYNSSSSDFNITKRTPFKRDPLAELATACKKYGIKLCLYYSLGRDWEDPDVPTNWPVKAGRSNAWDFPDEDAKVFNRYFERKVKPQIKELLTNYGPIAMMWFDTPELISNNESAELRALISKLQPECLVNSRIGNGYGDFEIFEQKFNTAPKDTWEACITMGRNWGYNRYDNAWKSTEMLVRNLVNVVANNGNLLLNLGPMGNGTFPAWTTQRLDSIGRWMKVNGEAIAGTHPYLIAAEGNEADQASVNKEHEKSKLKDAVYDATPTSLSPDIFFTAKKNEVFAILRSWKQKDFVIKSFKGIQIKSVELLGTKHKTKWKMSTDGLSISLPYDFNKINQIPVYTLKIKLQQ